MKRVLVTGGAGYIGAHVCKALAGRGYLPVVLDDLSHGHRDAVRWGPLHVGNILDDAALNHVFAEAPLAGVIHLAGKISVAESVQRPDLYYQVNVEGSLALFRAMLRHGVRRVIFSSSAAIYGTAEAAALIEDTPAAPENPYGRSKLFVEQMLADMAAAHGLASVSLRYFNAAGADPEGEIGERHDPETHLVPLAIEAALGRRPDIKLFGDDFATPDGTCIRDYVHVADLASAHVSALEFLPEQAMAAAINIGNGQGYSVREVLQAVARIVGRDFPVVVMPRRSGDVARLVADTAKARRVLNFQPRLSALDTIIDTAHRWHARI